jgi:hypothetical protein
MPRYFKIKMLRRLLLSAAPPNREIILYRFRSRLVLLAIVWCWNERKFTLFAACVCESAGGVKRNRAPTPHSNSPAHSPTGGRAVSSYARPSRPSSLPSHPFVTSLLRSSPPFPTPLSPSVREAMCFIDCSTYRNSTLWNSGLLGEIGSVYVRRIPAQRADRRLSRCKFDTIPILHSTHTADIAFHPH